MNAENMKITEIREYLKNNDNVEEEFLRRLLKSDKKGVRDLAEKYLSRGKVDEKAVKKIEDKKILERKGIEKGFKLIGGIDEAGRGPLAGPVVASVVIHHIDCVIPGVDDSKKLSKNAREELFEEIMDKALHVGIGIATAEEIDTHNILEATKIACYRALEQIAAKPDLLITDCLKLTDANIPFWDVIKGDSKSFSIASASIIAKVTRDKMMADYHEEYPIYNFASNKGYGCKEHLDLLRKHGPSTLHRLSFRRVGRSSNGGIRSKSFDMFKNQIKNCINMNQLSEISEKIKIIADFLPQCEIKELREIYSRKTKEFK